MSTSYPWIYVIPGILYLLFYLAALVVLMAKYRHQPQAALLSLIGVGIMLMGHVGSWVSVWVVQRFVDSDQFMLIHGMLQIVVSLAHLFGIGLILSAVFVGRRPLESGHAAPSQQPPSSERPPASDNPYASPQPR